VTVRSRDLLCLLGVPLSRVAEIQGLSEVFRNVSVVLATEGEPVLQ